MLAPDLIAEGAGHDIVVSDGFPADPQCPFSVLGPNDKPSLDNFGYDENTLGGLEKLIRTFNFLDKTGQGCIDTRIDLLFFRKSDLS